MDQQFAIAQDWRNYFEHSGLENSTYKLFIETAYGCHADCAGCPIPKVNRAAKDPKWELSALQPTLSSFAENLLNWRQTQQLPGINNLAITVGPAENLIFTPEYLEGMAHITKQFAKDIHAKEFHLAVSTSGLFSTAKVASKIAALEKVLNKDELAFAWIINLRQFAKTPQHYYQFAQYIFQHANLVELEINMDSDIHNIDDSVLKDFGDFVNAFPFMQLDFAYAINDGNNLRTYLKQKEFIDFIEKLRSFSGAPFRQFFSQWDQQLNVQPSSDFDFNQNFEHLFNTIIHKSIRLNALSEWHFAQNILGTIYYDDNFKIRPLDSANPFGERSIHNFKTDLKKYLTKQLINHTQCDECMFKNTCISSGFMNYTKFSQQDEKYCTNPAYTIFERQYDK